MNWKPVLYAGAGVGAIVIIFLLVQRRGAEPMVMSSNAPIPGFVQPVTLTDMGRRVLQPPAREPLPQFIADLGDDCGCMNCGPDIQSTVQRPVVNANSIMPPQFLLAGSTMTAAEREALNNGTAQLVLDEYSARGYYLQSFLDPLSHVHRYMVLPKSLGGDLFSTEFYSNPAGDVGLLQ